MLCKPGSVGNRRQDPEETQAIEQGHCSAPSARQPLREYRMMSFVTRPLSLAIALLTEDK